MGTKNGFLASLKRAHEALHADLGKLDAIANLAASESASEVHRVQEFLTATQTHLTDHFRFEEQNGYMDAVRQREPRFERQIQQLAQEHERLGRSLDLLVAEARAMKRVDPTFRERLRRWIGDLRNHELQENDLIQDAFDTDLAGED